MLCVPVAGLLLMLALPTSSAFAGRLWVTGHDQDFHCDGSDAGTTGACHYDAIAFGYVRGSAPDPTKKVLVLDNNGLSADHTATGLGVPHDTVDPSSAAFATTPLDTATYSAIVIASDASCGGCDLNGTPSGTSQTPDSDAINARAGEIATFFNAGGGVLAFAGAEHGDGNATDGPDTYYNFAPIPVGGQPVSSPFCLTATGISVGLQDSTCPDTTKRNGTLDDINCCPTHNSFTVPAPGDALQVAETDSTSLAETLIAEGAIVGGKIVNDKTPPTSTAANPACNKAGSVTVTVTDETGGSGAKAVHFKLDGGAETTAATTGNPGTAKITVATGKHSVEFWGEDNAGNQEASHHTITVVVDQTKPTISIKSNQGRNVYLIGQKATVRIKATDALGGLQSNPSRKAAKLSTKKAGRFKFVRTATDKCGNKRSATFRYQVKAVARRRVAPRRRVPPRFTG